MKVEFSVISKREQAENIADQFFYNDECLSGRKGTYRRFVKIKPQLNLYSIHGFPYPPCQSFAESCERSEAIQPRKKYFLIFVSNLLHSGNCMLNFRGF
jgi:hypothetical protein